jgi:hypothetical protein
MPKAVPDDPFVAAQQRRSDAVTTSRCVVCAGVAGQDKAFREAFHAALLNETISSPTIVAVLAQRDVKTSDTAIRQHRQGLRIGSPCPGLQRVLA